MTGRGLLMRPGCTRFADASHSVAMVTPRWGNSPASPEPASFRRSPGSSTSPTSRSADLDRGSYRHKRLVLDGNSVLSEGNDDFPRGPAARRGWGRRRSPTTRFRRNCAARRKNGKMPDMGLINSRYTLDVMGSQQQVQIRSWTPRLELRFAKTVPFAWKPDVWYVVKFRSK